MSLAEMRSPASYLENEDCEAPAAHKTPAGCQQRDVIATRGVLSTRSAQ